MSIWSKNPPPPADDEPYDPSRLFEIGERGMTLNLDQFLKKPGVKEDIEALRDIGRIIRERQRQNRA